jgi:hypothetical protein
MRSNKALMGVLAAVAVVAGVFTALPAIAAGPNKDSVTGGGRADGTPPGVQFAISAKSGPLGEDPKGHVKLDNPNGTNVQDTRGDVVCLNVQGNKATIEFQIEKSNDPDDVGKYRQVFVEDNGKDDAISSSLPRDNARGCDIRVAPAQPILHGNIQIDDAS